MGGNLKLGFGISADACDGDFVVLDGVHQSLRGKEQADLLLRDKHLRAYAAMAAFSQAGRSKGRLFGEIFYNGMSCGCNGLSFLFAAGTGALL